MKCSNWNLIFNSLIQRQVERPEDTSSPSFVYEYAAYYGRTMRDEEGCGSLFSNCHESPQKLKKFMDETFVSDICDGPDQIIPSATNALEDEEDLEYRVNPAGERRRTDLIKGSKSGGGITFPLN